MMMGTGGKASVRVESGELELVDGGELGGDLVEDGLAVVEEEVHQDEKQVHSGSNTDVRLLVVVVKVVILVKEQPVNEDSDDGDDGDGLQHVVEVTQWSSLQLPLSGFSSWATIFS